MSAATLAGEEASNLGRLTILQARMNPDLAMGDELLKKTGSGNLFMVFGEPDIEVLQATDDRLTLEIRGPDVYDPTTGAVRSSSVDDIAAWFLDTDYDGDAFFVRHAYFTGADDPYDKLRRAPRADISDEAWATVNSTVSRPFPRPQPAKSPSRLSTPRRRGDEGVGGHASGSLTRFLLDDFPLAGPRTIRIRLSGSVRRPGRGGSSRGCQSGDYVGMASVGAAGRTFR